MDYSFQATARTLDIEAGKPIVIMNEKEAQKRSIFLNDRVKINHNESSVVAIVDFSPKMRRDEVFLFEETRKRLGVKDGETVNIELTKMPSSIDYIRNKIVGRNLSKNEIERIVEDTVNLMLSDPELTAFNIAIAMSEFSLEETYYLTESMVKTGERIDITNAFDKHCIGGVPGNRTTPLIVPIISAAGLKIPKTSSRAISSPAGTADTMEVLAQVDFSADEITELIKETDACMVWGGNVNLAPADDEFIRVRKSLGLDPTELVLSSVLAKKKAVGSDTVLIDIPVGEEAKIKEDDKAQETADLFEKLGSRLDMDIITLISDGSEPIGRGIGPALEARDVLRILESNGAEGPVDLKNKSLRMANMLLEEASSELRAEQILESGRAYEKMKQIIKAQNGDILKSEDIEMGKFSRIIRSKEEGRIAKVRNNSIKDIALTAGCPREKKAGLYLHQTVGDQVEKDDKLMTVYSDNKKRLQNALEEAENNIVFEYE